MRAEHQAEAASDQVEFCVAERQALHVRDARFEIREPKGVLLAQGRWAEVETELLAALEVYQRTFPPMSVFAVNRLALLRIAQGRWSEAAELLSGYEDDPSAALGMATLHLANDAPALALRIAKRRLDVIGSDALQAPPFLSILVEAAVAQADIPGAKQAALKLARVVDSTYRTGLTGASQLANGMVAALEGDAAAGRLLEQALDTFQALGMPLEAARTRLRLAEYLAGRDEESAKVECQSAKTVFDQIGARRLADCAAELLRRLGLSGSAGPRLNEPLSRREQEVLELLALGLSNAEIGGRLFISPKTVENHVGHVLGKLNLKSRAAAAAYVVRTRGAPGATQGAR
jgi:DNA-binding CsgD family transcriptional regulator